MTRSHLAGASGLALCLFAPSARAQGSDVCSTPTAISGTGTFAVSTVGATDSAQQTGVCATIHRDVWFAWTSPATVSMNLTTCGATAADTVLAVYPGTACPAAGTHLACNDDTCGQQSSLFFNATSGAQYLIQIGAWAANTSYTATFSIQPGSSACSSPALGPDVIVGEITDIQNVTGANGLDSFTLGTTSCNVGDATVNWFGATNLHPVISETFYKYKVVGGAGRFEQIGMSWLKHGFASDADNVCCTCQNPLNNQILGIGCADPYVASQAGAQSGLAPRWQVNPHTGVFPYPGANPAWSGVTARRCESAVAELEVSGGTTHFYAECRYDTQDDAQAGNNDNNSSYKEMVVTGGPTNFTFATSGTTQRTLPAIRAWPLLEPGVTLTNVHVAGDGLFVVGSHATDLGGGQWHYEFAVFNMNADRAAGSFSVPIAAGVTVTNIGFHDVSYRNGDGQGSVNQTGTDWTGTLSGGAIAWACETEAQNSNANAIRWATTYNFRFDADVPPQNGLATLGLWKAGSPAAVSASAQVPASLGPPPFFTTCFGDGSGTPCPCGNGSTPGQNVGCLNSLGLGGGIQASGFASVSVDTLVLSGSGMPDSSALYFQGTGLVGGGAGSAFGDGLRCAGGAVIRLGTKVNAGGASQYPGAGDLSISVKGADAAGDSRTYQCWYRNAASFCQPETFNLTSLVQATWLP